MLKEQTKAVRITDVLHNYWKGLKYSRDDIPWESDIRARDLRDIWPNCFLLKVEELQRKNFNYTYIGDSLIDMYGWFDLGYKEICDKLIDPKSSMLRDSFEEVIKTGTPAFLEEEFDNRKGGVVKFRSCMLPLSSSKDSRKIESIIGGVRWKLFQ